MAPHVYARISGFGWTLLPRAPFWLARVPDQGRSVVVEHETPTGPRRVTLAFDGGAPRTELGETASAVKEVLDLFQGPDLEDWRVETAVFTACWPDGFVMVSDPQPPGFSFRGPDESLIYVQGPVPTERLPPLTAMTGVRARRYYGMASRGASAGSSSGTSTMVNRGDRRTGSWTTARGKLSWSPARRRRPLPSGRQPRPKN
jgi:hypothetical protein